METDFTLTELVSFLGKYFFVVENVNFIAAQNNFFL